jgi:putative peptide zinc metalloprotease protein
VYFNAIFILAMAGAYFATGFEPLLIPILLAHLEIFRQLLPLLRLDGYYVLSDLTGVHDLFGRIKPILVGFLPWRRSDEKARELKWWVRLVVTLWVLVFVAFLVLNIAYILAFAPRIAATGWDSFQTHLSGTREAFGTGDGTAGAAGVIKLIALALPALGIAFGLTRGGTRLTKGMWNGTRGRPFARMGSLLLLVGALAGLTAFWWPDGDYVPIREGERWTVDTAAVAVSHTARGEPAFTEVAPEETEQQEPDRVEPSIEPDREEPIEGEPDVVITPSPALVTPSPTPVSPDPTVSVSPEPTTEPSLSPSPTTSPTTGV